jgi:methyl-accepting chemotaxis protein
VLATFHLDQMLGPLLVRLPGNNARLILLDGSEQVLVDGFAQPASGDHLLNGQQAAHPAALLAALQGKATPAGVVAGLYTVHGEQYRYYASRMSSTDWLLAYVQPEADLLAAYREAKYLGWAQLFFVVLAALLLVAMMQRLVLRPLQALAGVQEAMRDGAVPTPVAVRGSGEFAAMAASYNRLVADLSASESRLRTIFEAFPEVGHRHAPGRWHHPGYQRCLP